MRNILFLCVFLSVKNLIAEDSAFNCAKIDSDKERLACYDNIFKIKEDLNEELALEDLIKSDEKLLTETKKSPAKIDKKQIAEFGLTDNQKKAANIEVEKITIATSISSVIKSAGGKTRFRLENNQLWESQSVLSSIKRINFKNKNEIIIEESTLGGFWMINKRSKVRIKVKRVS
jgi:uncharacterized protein|tara:strand:- start:748 stop:1272 length:525 start_codon:yes stop_codon:yes gene_type:complete